MEGKKEGRKGKRNERQQKELDSYKFKIKVSNKEAEYYSRQIK